MITITKKSIFDADAEAIVNPVNCVGVMGKGLARQFKQKYPDNFTAYKKSCDAGKLTPGKMHVYEYSLLINPKIIINFPTKRHWRDKSRIEDIKTGLYDLVRVVRERNIKSVAIPPLGCGLGGLNWDDVSRLIEEAFSSLPDVNVILFEEKKNKYTFIYTAQYRYDGPNRLDITVKGNDPVGSYFAPTWDMVKRYKNTGNTAVYTVEYNSILANVPKDKWDLLLSQEELVLVCFCRPGEFCHRVLLAEYLNQLHNVFYMGELGIVIDNFRKDDVRFLSNFYPVDIHYDGITYGSVEHMFQAFKATNMDDHLHIARAKNPKAAGRKVKLRDDWETVKKEVMWKALNLKFGDQKLAAALKSTGKAFLKEGNNWHDNFWGSCGCESCGDRGQNTLGKMLMAIRAKI